MNVIYQPGPCPECGQEAFVTLMEDAAVKANMLAAVKANMLYVVTPDRRTFMFCTKCTLAYESRTIGMSGRAFDSTETPATVYSRIVEARLNPGRWACPETHMVFTGRRLNADARYRRLGRLRDWQC